MRYRADIDGLRAVAVVPVVLFHANLPIFSGGFVGVDVFFVISGFLITGLIRSDLETGKFSIPGFYQRRVRRIFPALISVTGFCAAVGFVILPPNEFRDLGKSIVFVTLFLSNFYFWKSTDYFSPNADSQPLLHTWSLGVEEQYYIFYPPILWLLWKLRWRIPATLGLAALLSFLMAAILIYKTPSAVFYLLPPRAWELLAGGIVAFGIPKPASSARLCLAAAVVGIGLILLPALFYTSKTLFPGLSAFPPTLGATLLIWSGAGQASPIHKLLASRPFVTVGQASYSLYLWHFPLIAFVTYLAGAKPNPALALATCVLAFLVSLASLRWIERPFRQGKGKGMPTRAAVAIPLTAMAGICGAGALVLATGGLPSRLDATSARYVSVAQDKTRHHYECMSVGDVIVPPDRACKLGAAGSQPVAMLWGDSHAMVTATAVEAAAKRNGASFLFAAAADCPVGLGFAISTTTETGLTSTPSYRYCEDYNRAMLNRVVRDQHIRSVILSSRWTNWRIGEPANPAEPEVDLRLVDATGTARSKHENLPIFERGFIRLIDRLTSAGKTVYIVGALPEPVFDVPHRLFIQRFGLAEQAGPIKVSDTQIRHATIMRIFGRFAHAASVRFVWPQSALCNSVDCPVIENGEPLYFDQDHLSINGALKTSRLYDGIFEQSHSD